MNNHMSPIKSPYIHDYVTDLLLRKVYPPMTNTNGVTILDWIESIPDVNILDSLEDDHICGFLDILVDQYRGRMETIKIVTPSIKQVEIQSRFLTKATSEKSKLLSYFPIIQLLHNVVNLKLESEIDIGTSRSPGTITILDWINEIPYRYLTSDIYDLNGDYLLEFLDLVKSKHSVEIENTEIRLLNLTKNIKVKLPYPELGHIKPSLTLDMLKTLQFLYDKYSIKKTKWF